METQINKIIKQTLELLETNKSHGNDFNLLKISGVGNSEVFTHTPILKELLDPNGSHGQKDLFLKSFINFFKIDFNIDDFITVRKEQRIKDYGQIDLMISNRDQIIIIENKIYAKDQPSQLYRYYEYTHNIKKKSFIIYLTLDGKKPSLSSLGRIKNIDDNYLIENELKNIDINLYCLSYKKDILIWLDEVLKIIVDKPNLVAGINQYLNLLKMLTGEIETVNKELNNILLGITPIELEAINKISKEYNSSAYRGALLYKLFEYTESEFLKTGDFYKSSEYPLINYSPDNCKKWFRQVSANNPAHKRDVIGCVLKSKINSNVTFLFVAATDYIYYGIVLDSLDLCSLDEIISKFPAWEKRHSWKKINKTWVSKSIGDLRNFSGEAFKLLTTNNNDYLDNFINERLTELSIIINE